MPDDQTDQEQSPTDDLELSVPAEVDAELDELGLPEDIDQKIRAIISASYSGPLPPPSYLEHYEKIVFGSAQRIIEIAEKDADHRRSIEDRLVNAEIDDRKLERRERRTGQFLGFGIGSIAIVAGAITAVLGSQIAGTFIGASGVVGLVTAFIVGKRRHSENEDNFENEDKSE